MQVRCSPDCLYMEYFKIIKKTISHNVDFVIYLRMPLTETIIKLDLFDLW